MNIRFNLMLICLVVLVGFTTNAFAQKVNSKSVKTTFLVYPENDISGYKTFSLRVHTGPHSVNHGFFRNWGINQDVIDKFVADQMSKNIMFEQLEDVEGNPDVWIEVGVGEIKFNLMPKVQSYKKPCKSGGDANGNCVYYYYDYSFQNPMILRIKDKEGHILYAEKFNEGIVSLGKQDLGGFESEEKLSNHYAADPQSALNNMFRKEIKRRLNAFELSTREVLSFDLRKETVDVNSGNGDFDYSELNKIQEEVIAVYEALKDSIFEPDKTLLKAIDVWNKEIAQVDLKNKNARISQKLAIALYDNKTDAYLRMFDIDNAMKSLIEAERLAKKSEISGYSNENKLNSLMDERFRMTTNFSNNNALVSNNYEDVIDYFAAFKASEKKANYVVVTEDDVMDEFEADYQKWLQMEDENKQMAAAKLKAVLAQYLGEDAAAKAIENPYKSQMTYTAAQGNMLMLMGSMSPQKLTEIPIEITQLTELNNLVLSYNQITSIPPEIGNLTELKVLNLSANKITSLPVELGKCSKLKTLNLNGNSISQADIDKIQKLLPDCKIKY